MTQPSAKGERTDKQKASGSFNHTSNFIWSNSIITVQPGKQLEFLLGEMHRYNSARQVVDHFKDSTLIHAMPHTKNAPLGSFRKVWGFIFVIGVVGLSYQFYLAFTNYYSYPIQVGPEGIFMICLWNTNRLFQVQILMQTSRSLMFPSVTICNNNPGRKS